VTALTAALMGMKLVLLLSAGLSPLSADVGLFCAASMIWVPVPTVPSGVSVNLRMDLKILLKA